MKKFTYLVLAGLCLATANPVFANKSLWKNYEGKAAPVVHPKQILSSDYQIVQLDQQSAKALLATAGYEPSSGVLITLPTPQGASKTFKVWNTPVMESDLQRSHSEIQTYTGVSVDDGTVTVKLSYTPMGFNAYVFSYNMDEGFYIEPAGYSADGYYVLAKTKDFKSSLSISQPCDPQSVSQLTAGQELTLRGNGTAQRTNGTVRHTYRAAIACTGEYAQLVTGSAFPTVSQVLSIITSTINNCNGVWEREFSVSLKLINANSSIIYTDGGADPYTDGQNDVAIGENQTNITTVIGAANYDVGHVLNTAGGGLASLASTCVDGSKASGVSGSSGVTDIHVIIHEVGHQLGAGHTFTANTGGCQGNGMAESAYEPGSGTSIMSYNGVCDANNTPSVHTEYYNQFNLTQVNNFLTTGGSTCGTTSQGQTPLILPNVDKRYIIPAYTPFELIAPEATKTVSSNSTTLYNWEQFDIGTLDMTEAQGSSITTGPVFSSFDPDSGRTRVFPTYDKLAANIYSDTGQRLPMVSRNLKFKLSARSVGVDGWGSHSIIDSVVNIKVVNGGEYFRVSTPNQNETWEPGQQYTVTWKTANTLLPTDSIQCGFVNIYMSLDGGLSFPIILATNVENTGTYNLTAPDLYTTKARIKIKSVGNIFFDVSHTNFKVNGNPSSVKGVDISDNISVYPNPATNMITLKNDNFKGQPLDVQMLNSVGQKIWSGNLGQQVTVPVSQLPRGTYFLYFRDANSGRFGVKNVSLF